MSKIKPLEKLSSDVCPGDRVDMPIKGNNFRIKGEVKTSDAGNDSVEIELGIALPENVVDGFKTSKRDLLVVNAQDRDAYIYQGDENSSGNLYGILKGYRVTKRAMDYGRL